MEKRRHDPERREFFRVVARVRPRRAVRVTEKLAELNPLDAVILDISGGGVLIHSRQWVSRSSRLRLLFELEGDPGEFDVIVSPTDVEWAEFGRYFRAHCEFVGLPRRDAERIVRFVYRKQLWLRRRGLSSFS